MPKTHPPYPPEFRRHMVELVRVGRDPEALAREFEPTAQSIRNWVAQADRDEGQREDGLSSDERQELTRLRRENRRLKEEREILGFSRGLGIAQETGSIPSKGSRSWERIRPCIESRRCAVYWVFPPAVITRGSIAPPLSVRWPMRC